MDSNNRGSNEDYLYGDLLQQGSFVSPVKTDNENSVDIYDGLDTDSQGGGHSVSRDTAGKSKPAKDCFDLYEEILAEERTAKEISLKEFQEKFVERERKVEELLKKLHEIQVQNSTLSNENTQLKKNISALIKTARLEIVRKDEEINRLNRRQSMNWIGNPGLRRYQNQNHHPPGSFNVPTTPQTDNRCPGQLLPCLPRPANTEHCQLAAHLNEEGNCLQGGPLGGASKPLEPKRQCNAQKSLPNSQPAPCRESPSKSSPQADKGPPQRQTTALDKTRPLPCEERRRIEKVNGEHLGRNGNAEKLGGSVTEPPHPRNKNKEPSFPEKTDKVEQQHPRSTRPHSEMRGSGRLIPEHNDKVRHRLTQDSLITCSKDSPEVRDKGRHAEKEERHKEKDTKRSDPRGRELKVDRKKDQRSNREVVKDKPRDDKLRSQETEKEREPERRRPEKTREHSKLTSPGSPRKSSKRNTCVAVEHSAGERRERKIESKKSGKERSAEDSKDQKSKHSKVRDNETSKDSAKQTSKSYDRSLNKSESRKEEKGKSEHKARRDHSISKHSSTHHGDSAKRERTHQGEKEKTRLSESNDKMTERNCVDQAQKRAEESVHGNSTANFQISTDEQNSARDADPKLQFMETLQLTVSPVKKPSTVLCEIGDEMQSSQLLGEDEVVRIAEQTAFASEEADLNLGISSQSEETPAMDTNCISTESPVGGSEIHVPQAIREPAETEMVPPAQPQRVEEEESFQVILVDDAPPQPMECDCPVDDSEKLAPIVVETMGTVEVVSETTYEMAESSMPLMEIDSIDAEEHAELVGSCAEVDSQPAGEVDGKSPEPVEADRITTGVQGGSSDCPVELSSAVKDETVLSLDADGKREDSERSVGVSAAAIEEWDGNSEPDFTPCEPHQPNRSEIDPSATINKTPVKNVCIPDDQEENSIQSIDFTYIGYIPEPISPLTSPLRPARPSTLESSGTQAEKVAHKDSAAKVQGGCPPRNCTLELNKENREPLFKDVGKASGTLVECSFSEEIEEGEIVSEEECVPEVQKPVSNIEVEKGGNHKEKGNSGKSTLKKETRLVNPDVSALSCSSKTLVKIKSGKKRRKSESLSSDQNADGLGLLSSTNSAERNQIKSSVSNLMEALMATRKSVRQKYMKLHKQFEIRRFQRIVEVASADFISVVQSSSFPKSRQPLKTSICAVIENILSQAKCNGIVQSIFLQQAPNMKERLWIFVEKQFDCMFDKVREMFISCESISLELALEEERKNQRIVKKRKKNKAVKQLENKVDGKLPKTKRSPSSSEPPLTNNLSSKKNPGKNKQASDEHKRKGTKELNKYSKKGVEFSAIDIPKEDPHVKVKNVLSVTQVNSNALNDPPTNSVKDCHDKTELGILTEQQASTLTFNLVSDAQMGEIFKCLLQGSDLLEQGISTLECNSWPIPEKTRPDIGTQLLGNDSTSEKALSVSQVDTVSWPPVAPNARTVGLRPPLDLDILDESCMLEIPDKVVQSKGSVISPPEDSNSQKIIESSSVLQMRSSISSILMEDLAVSLTVPSPLKSDGQISFLTSQNGEPLHDGVNEAILSAHYSESALLDEEDASEQDIHLALDSDNSSSRSSNSSTWNRQISASAFQYQLHPPMQAVVMEKSNDHFIVKISCRPPAAEATQQSSPPSAVKERQAAELGPNKDPSTGTAAEETLATCSNAAQVFNQEDSIMSEPLPNQTLIVEHPADVSKNMEESGVDVDVKLPHSEEDRPSVENHVDVKSSLETPSDNAERDVMLAAPTCTTTVLEQDSTSVNKKRKNNMKVDSTVKRARKEKELLKSNNRKDKETKVKRSSSSAKKTLSSKTVVHSKKAMVKCSQSTPRSSPTSLPAKNVIKKNGEVVVTWTREDDRTILMGCQQKGANEETFGHIAGKLHRSPRQVSERFHRLMKLFKKSENMN
ncbi:CASP8-associated protein 2 isoform X2 [Mustelus asterias]